MCYGRCHRHFVALDSKERERLKGMLRPQREVEYKTAKLPPEKPRWTYEGDEQALIAMTERQEREKDNLKSN